MKTKLKAWAMLKETAASIIPPRPLIKTIVRVVDPKIGNKIYDGVFGSAGFLCEAYEYLRQGRDLTTKEYEQLQKKDFIMAKKRNH